MIHTLRFIKNAYRFSIIKTSYPYQFGGVVGGQKSSQCESILKSFFGNDVLNGFTSAYIAILNALVEKDQSMLNETLSKNLTKDITFQNINFLNYDEEISTYCSQIFVVLGATFQRTPDAQFTKFPVDEKNNFIKFYLSSGLKFMPSMSMSLPILFGTKVYFEGRTKLQPENEEPSEATETHMMQFEIENKISISQMMGMMGKMKGLNKENHEQMIKFLIGDEYEWKIGDMDHMLNGNIDVK